MSFEALVKAIVSAKIKGAASEIQPGEYPLAGTRVVIELDGVAVKGEPEMYTPTTELLSKAVVAFAFRLLGVQKERFKEILSLAHAASRAAEEQDGTQTSEYVAAFVRDFEAVEAELNEELEKLPKKERPGKLNARRAQAEVFISYPPAAGITSATVAVPAP